MYEESRSSIKIVQNGFHDPHLGNNNGIMAMSSSQIVDQNSAKV